MPFRAKKFLCRISEVEQEERIAQESDHHHFKWTTLAVATRIEDHHATSLMGKALTVMS